MSTDRPRPPSVERLLAAVRPQLADGAAAGRGRGGRAGRGRGRAGAPRGRGGSDGAATTSPRTVRERLEGFTDPAESGLTTVLNATGVILHTNLGRAPWPAVAIEAAARAAGAYSLLEFDREAGRRGPRFRAAEDHLIALTGAEDALVTVNNAAALALAVGLAGKHGVAVSRGELVEIGGGVRIPEIVRRAGARLIEVGTTNRTRAADFEAPLADGRATVVLRVHPSNFAQTGFVEAPDPVELARLAHEHGAIVIDDLGSGALLETAAFGLPHEPTPAERLAAGADLVTFSGDKLVGGPQAGLIVGRADLIARIRRDPLARAVRPEKVTLAALAATLGLYRAGRATTEIPVWRMIAATPEDLGRRADAILAALPAAVRERVSVTRDGIGGRRRVAAGRDARVGRTGRHRAGRGRPGEPASDRRAGGRRSCRGGAVLLDLRTIDPSDDAALGQALARALAARDGGAVEDHVTVVIGTAGHIDHGKTTLLRALTGIDADRLPEERRRGMTIDVGYAHLTLPDGTELDFVDVPGHDRLVGNMLVGAGEIDAAMLVVAADDGPRAQTIEHLALLDALGIRHGLAVVTKADVAGPERTAEVVAAVGRLLEGTTLAGSPVLAVSSVDGEGIDGGPRGPRGTARPSARVGRERGGSAAPARASRSTASSRSRAAAPS